MSFMWSKFQNDNIPTTLASTYVISPHWVTISWPHLWQPLNKYNHTVTMLVVTTCMTTHKKGNHIPTTPLTMPEMIKSGPYSDSTCDYMQERELKNDRPVTTMWMLMNRAQMKIRKPPYHNCTASMKWPHCDHKSTAQQLHRDHTLSSLQPYSKVTFVKSS